MDIKLTTHSPINLDDYHPVLCLSQLKAGDTVLYISGHRESLPPQPEFSEGEVASIEQGRGGLYVVLVGQSRRIGNTLTTVRGVKRT